MATAARLHNPVDFDTIAELYDSVFPQHITEHYLQRRVSYIQRHAAGATALDVGAGTGLLAERLNELGIDVVALDPFPDMLARLLRRCPEIPVVVAPGNEMPLPNDHFDLTYSVAVMHHIADPALVRRTLAEMVRVTRPGGRILVWDHNPLNPYWPYIMARVPQDNGAERLLPMRELVVGLTDAGATIVRSEQLGLMPEFVPEHLMPLVRSIESGMERIPGIRRLCSHNVVLALKPE
ncbi:MAG: class I SAM-dependent methyltransferase [Candidatus Binatia bacterium]